MIRRRRAAVLGILALMAAIPAGLASPGVGGPAYADEPTDLQVTIESMSPQALTPAGLLVISGRVGNRSATPLSGIAVRLTLGTWPLGSRSQIPAAMTIGALDGDPAIGLSQWQVRGQFLPETTTRVTAVLMPGAQADFRIVARAADLPLPVDGVYVIGVEAVSDYLSDPYEVTPRGSQRTFLPWVPDPQAVLPADIVWLWPIAGLPEVDGSGVLLSTTLPQELASGGRLRRLVDVGGSTTVPITWIVDPQLLQAAQSMTGGYRVLVDGEIRTGDDPQAATQWLSALRTATDPPSSAAGRQPARQTAVQVIPYADIDVAAAQRAGLDRDVVRAISVSPSITEQVLGRAAARVIEWAPAGNLNDSSIGVLAASGVSTVVMSADAMPPDPPVDFTPSGSAVLTTSVGTVRAILADPALSMILDTRPTEPAQVLATRQRFLAETAMVALELPDTSRTLVAAPSTLRWDPPQEMLAAILGAVERAPWIRPRSFDDFAESQASTVTRSRVDYGIDRDDELAQAALRRNADAQEQLGSLAGVLSDPGPVVEPLSGALLRAESSAWRTHPEAGEQLLDRTVRDITSRVDSVRILSRNSVTLSGESGSIPITIANDLDQAVEVTLRLSTVPAARLLADPVPGVVIQPGRKTSLEVAARVVGGGSVPVTVELLTKDGKRFGESVVIDLRSTAYARAASWVVGAALTLLGAFVVIAVIRRIRQVSRSGAQA